MPKSQAIGSTPAMIREDASQLWNLLLKPKSMVFERSDTEVFSNNNLLTIFRIASFSRFVIFAVLFLVLPSRVGQQSWGRLLTVIDALLLTIFLSGGVFRRLFDRRYMLIALLWSSITPLLISSFTIYLFFSSSSPPELLQEPIEQIENFVVLTNIAQTLPILLIPLLIVSWLYTQQAVIRFCLGTSLLDVTLITLFVPLGGTNLAVVLAMIVFRLVTLSLVGLVVNQLVTVHKKQARALQEANIHLRDYAATREHLIASRERNRLAREMHDTLAHSLAAATVQLEAVQVIWEAQPGRAKNLVQESAATMRSGLQDTRRALQALRAETLESVGFVASIQLLAESIRTRYTVEVTVEAPVDVLWLTQDQEHIIYRIVQEALLNSAQHAGGGQISVVLAVADEALRVSIIDDGIGFEPEAIDTQAHFGVQGMRERAAMIGAELTITSNSGKGTHIQVKLQRETDAHTHL